ncbi:PAS domain-containing protein [Marinibaculum pumilum]|uniref:PAS domain-containing protein n=1 Tax=Marinibaculum pumilum TaxID=1766165 RepID=A0ABV7L4Y6_9PROT
MAATTPNLAMRPQAGPELAVDPDLRLQHPRLVDLLAFWQGKCRDGWLPARADFRPDELVKHLPYLVLTEIRGDPLRMRYRLIGTAITKAMGRDRTGMDFHDLYPPKFLTPMKAGFRWLLENRRPLRGHGRIFQPDRRLYDFEILNLPLAADGEQVDMVLHELILSRADKPGGSAYRPRGTD